MNIEEWVKKVNEFVAEIANDSDLSDSEYIEVLEEIESLAQSNISAKQEEMGDDLEE